MKSIGKAIILASILIPTMPHAQEFKLTDADRKAVVADVVKYLAEHPKEFTDAVAEYKKKNEMANAFEGAAEAPWQGNSAAPVRIVVFSDYGCADCVATEHVLDDVLSGRKDVVVIHQALPQSGEDAIQAAFALITVFNTQGQEAWAKLRAGILKYGATPEGRIHAFADAGLKPTGEPAADVKLSMLKSAEMAKRAGLEHPPGIIVMKGDGVVPLTGKVTQTLIDQAVAVLDGKK